MSNSGGLEGCRMWWEEGREQQLFPGALVTFTDSSGEPQSSSFCLEAPPLAFPYPELSTYLSRPGLQCCFSREAPLSPRSLQAALPVHLLVPASPQPRAWHTAGLHNNLWFEFTQFQTRATLFEHLPFAHFIPDIFTCYIDLQTSN